MLKTISSVSGGKSSAYMAIHYPTDFYIFALVKSNDTRLAIKDTSLREYCESKVPSFIGTYESPKTLQVLRELEQMLGKEIAWVTSEFALEDFVYNTTDLPGYRSRKPRLYDSRTRFCTTTQKILPIAWHCWLNYGTDPIIQNIGFRYDEPKRVKKWTCKNDKIKLPLFCGLHKNQNWKYFEKEWRVTNFPLHEDKVTKSHVTDFWRGKSFNFPEISNCVMCPLHTDIELAKHAFEYPEHAIILLEQELKVGASFGDRFLVDRIMEPKTKNQKRQNCSCTN
jgi:hypothetical protein